MQRNSYAENWIIEDGAMKVFTSEGKKPGEGSDGI